MQAPEGSNTVRSFGLVLGDAVSRIVSSVFDQSWKVSVPGQSVSAAPDAGAARSYKLTFSGALEGEAFLMLPLLELGKLTGRNGSNSDASSDLGGLLASALESNTEALGKTLLAYGAVHVQVESVNEPAPGKEQMLELVAKAEGSNEAISMFFFFSPKLISTVQAVAARTFAYPAAAPSANLDLVLDVELNVTLRFGQRQLTLREVLDLTSGSVVELDREVDEPVELVLDGRVVARGEAVIIDGNYGMRITQVLQPLAA